MQSQVEELSPVLIAVKIEVPWDTIAQDLDLAYRKVQKTAKIRGFRPGKVPRNVVKKLMGPSVRNEVGNSIVQKGIGAAIDEHSLDPIAIPDVDAGDFEDGSTYTFTARMEVRPSIEDVKLEGLNVERKLIRVPDSAVDAEITRLQEQNGQLVSPDPTRASQAGDVLTFSATLSLEGADRPDLSVEETQAQLGEGGLLPEIEAGLTGLTIGEEKEIEVNFPGDYGHPELKGKSARLTVTLKEVQEKLLPALDDEFAKDLEHDSMSAMKASIREKLEETSTRRADAEVREAVIKKLVDDNPVPVPPSMVERQHRAMVQEMMQFQRYMGQSMDLDESAADGMKGESERKVQAGLLLGEIAKRESLSVTTEEVEEEFTKIAEGSGQHIAKVRAEHQGDARGNLESRLLENKLLEYLLSKATITETEVDEETSGDSK